MTIDFFRATPQAPIAWYRPAVSPTSPCLPTQQLAQTAPALCWTAAQRCPRGAQRSFPGLFPPCTCTSFKDFAPGSMQIQNWLLFSNRKLKGLEGGRVGGGEGGRETTRLLLIILWVFKDLRKFYRLQMVLLVFYFYSERCILICNLIPCIAENAERLTVENLPF